MRTKKEAHTRTRRPPTRSAARAGAAGLEGYVRMHVPAAELHCRSSRPVSEPSLPSSGVCRAAPRRRSRRAPPRRRRRPITAPLPAQGVLIPLAPARPATRRGGNDLCPPHADAAALPLGAPRKPPLTVRHGLRKSAALVRL